MTQPGGPTEPTGPRPAGPVERDWATTPRSGVPPRPSPLPPPRPVPAAPGQAVPGAHRGAGALPRTAPPRARRARLSLRRLDPWSVFLTSLMLSLCLGVMTIVGAVVLYAVLSALGVPDSVNKLVETLQGGAPVLTAGRFLGGAALLAAVNVVLLSVLATLWALLYNLVATFTGGLEVTLTERD